MEWSFFFRQLEAAKQECQIDLTEMQEQLETGGRKCIAFFL